MHVIRITFTSLCLIQLGTLELCLGLSVRSWKENQLKLSNRAKFSGSYNNPPQISLPVSSLRLTATNRSRTNGVVDCPEIHQLCGQPRTLMINWQCSCEEDCQKFGECCPDLPYDDINRKIYNNVECINFKQPIGLFGFYMVSRCPDSWTNQNVKHLCENKNTFEDDPLCHVPVVSTSTNNTYRNLFCAVCNKDYDIIAWKIPKECGEEASNPSNFSANCQKDFKPPNEEKSPKSCLWSVISSCSNESASDDIKKKCYYYYEPINYTDENGTKVTYKNKFCAFCNGVEENRLYCPREHEFGFMYNPVYTSLTVLLDVDFSKGGTAVGKMTRCEPGYIFDPWMEKCRNVFCGRLYEYRNEKCIKSFISDNTQNVLYNNTLDSGCFKVSINISDYIIHDNGSVILLISGEMLNPGEYEMLQNDSILVCTSESTNYIEKFSDAQNYLTIICISISMCCLLVKIVLFFAIPEPRKVPTLVVIFLSVSLFIAQFLLLAGSNQSETALCVCIGVALHFFILASVFWTNVLAFDIWKTFSTVKKNVSCYYDTSLIRYTIYSWGTPLLIVFLGSIVEWLLPHSEFSPEYGHYVCWISNRVALLSFFAAPLGATLIVNVIFFSMTAITIAKTSKVAKFARQSTGENNHIKFVLYIKLALVMGLTWIFGFVSAYTDNIVMWYLFIIFNGLQGTYILLAFSHFKRRSTKNARDTKSSGSGTKTSLTNSANSRTSKK